MKKTNNKGFSLVELIIVIAIMAILIGVLAPQYIKYVEKSRVSSDEDMMDSLTKAVQTAVTDDEYYDGISAGDSITITGSAAPTISGSTLGQALSEYYGALGSTTKFKSKTYKPATCKIAVVQLSNTSGQNTGYTAERSVSGATDTTKNGTFR